MFWEPGGCLCGSLTQGEEAELVIPSVKKGSKLAWRRGRGRRLAGGLCTGRYLHGESNKTVFAHKRAPPGPISCSNKIKGDGWSREQQAELGALSAE